MSPPCPVCLMEYVALKWINTAQTEGVQNHRAEITYTVAVNDSENLGRCFCKTLKITDYIAPVETTYALLVPDQQILTQDSGPASYTKIIFILSWGNPLRTLNSVLSYDKTFVLLKYGNCGNQKCPRG